MTHLGGEEEEGHLIRVWGKIYSEGAHQQRRQDGYWGQKHLWGPGVVGGLREGGRGEGGREVREEVYYYT